MSASTHFKDNCFCFSDIDLHSSHVTIVLEKDLNLTESDKKYIIENNELNSNHMQAVNILLKRPVAITANQMPGFHSQFNNLGTCTRTLGQQAQTLILWKHNV